MREYKKVIEHFDVTGLYESPVLGEFEAETHLARVAVLGTAEEIVWERTVRDRIISYGIPIPFFDRRLGRIEARAAALVNKLNT